MPSTWQQAFFCLAMLLFGGHGIFTLLVRNRKDTVSFLIATNSQLSKDIGACQGKIDLLTKQIREIRKEKHYYRNLANRYKLKYLVERNRSNTLKMERDTLREKLGMSPIHEEEERQSQQVQDNQ